MTQPKATAGHSIPAKSDPPKRSFSMLLFRPFLSPAVRFFIDFWRGPRRAAERWQNWHPKQTLADLTDRQLEDALAQAGFGPEVRDSLAGRGNVELGAVGAVHAREAGADDRREVGASLR